MREIEKLFFPRYPSKPLSMNALYEEIKAIRTLVEEYCFLCCKKALLYLPEKLVLGTLLLTCQYWPFIQGLESKYGQVRIPQNFKI